MKTEIYEYVKEKRKGRKQKVGIFVGKKIGDEVLVGWSRVNTKEGDTFNFESAVKIAKDRLGINYEAPQSLKKKMGRFSERCKRYFKEAKVVIV